MAAPAGLLYLDTSALVRLVRREPETEALLAELGAIHLATALSLAGDLGGFACYDTRLAAEARGAGVTVVAPV
jgi:hypothetical protein